jgi:hypothetical protein
VRGARRGAAARAAGAAGVGAERALAQARSGRWAAAAWRPDVVPHGGSTGEQTRTREDLEVAGAEPARWERTKGARGSGMCRYGAAMPERTRVRK